MLASEEISSLRMSALEVTRRSSIRTWHQLVEASTGFLLEWSWSRIPMVCRTRWVSVFALVVMFFVLCHLLAHFLEFLKLSIGFLLFLTVFRASTVSFGQLASLRNINRSRSLAGISGVHILKNLGAVYSHLFIPLIVSGGVGDTCGVLAISWVS